MPASPPSIQGKSRMRERACTDLCGGRSAMVVPTATTEPLPNFPAQNHHQRNARLQQWLARVTGNCLARGVAQANQLMPIGKGGVHTSGAVRHLGEDRLM